MIGLGLSIPEVALRASNAPTPSQILGAALLGSFDAENFGSLTLAGSSLAAWLDTKAGASATAAGGLQPLYSATGFNGRPVVTMDGVDDTLEIASAPYPTGVVPCEIWALVDQTALVADTGQRSIFSYGGSATTSHRSVRRVVVSGVNRAQVSVGTGAGSVAATDTVVDFSGRHLVRVRIEAAQVGIAVDGNPLVFTACVPATGTTRTRIGAGTAGTAAGFCQGGINSIFITQLTTTPQSTAFTQLLMSRRGA